MARRSLLFSPGDQPELLAKAPKSGADVIVFDLEDAVAPERKPTARAAINDLLTDDAFDPDCEVCVRVNPGVDIASDDIEAVVAGTPRLDSLMLPKVDNRSDVEQITSLLDGQGANLPLIALLESAGGVLHAEAIATVSEVDAVAFGAEDLAADIGATRTEKGMEVLYARERVVLAASAAGIEAIDTIHADIDDHDGLDAATNVAIELGYDGKMAIHPGQVPIINEAFTPDPEQIEWAKRVLAAREDASADNRGVFRVDGEMIDAPLVAQATRIIERADADER
jgi:citrate lyase subunit beta/citryl-CoA lyase